MAYLQLSGYGNWIPTFCLVCLIPALLDMFNPVIFSTRCAMAY
jgi:hypothetical protein